MTYSFTGDPAAVVDADASSTDAQPQLGRVIRLLKQSINRGRPWQEALLEAMERWTLPSEMSNGVRQQYLIRGEAFDWLLLARRLAAEVDDLIPAAERRSKLQTGHFIFEFAPEEVRRLLGVTKYRAYLNYWYGVTVEQGLQLAIRSEVRKERVSLGYSAKARVSDTVFSRIYGHMRSELLTEFREEAIDDDSLDSPDAELKAFTYWLFKLRLKQSDPSRVASDTRKALEWLSVKLGTLPSVAAEDLSAYLASHRA
tara:strand:- start:1942 stop:2709 length:768 start_codon:yes stop_codon:yes gene_type:complete